MQRVIKDFERELRQKLVQKCPSNQQEDAFLTKAFKFFDIHNEGAVNFDQFARTVEKIGVIIEKEHLRRIFAEYDANQNGSLDYKELSARLTGNEPRPTTSPKQPVEVSPEEDPRAMMELFRDKLKARGARGMIGLQRIFKIMDDDGSQTLSMPEFIKAVRDFRMGISEDSVPALFDAFDTNRDGTINYDEFLRAVRGPLNQFRREMVEKAFRKIDKDGSGEIEINDIKDTYNAAKHPDVIQGKKSEAQVLMEFLETFETHHNVINGKVHDSIVTLDEFLEYYTNISASIDDDQYFQLMMNNSWNLRGDANTYKKFDKGWSVDDTEKPKKDFRQPPQYVQRSGQMSGDNPLVNTHKYYKPSTTASKNSTALQMYGKPPMPEDQEKEQKVKLYKEVKQNQRPRDETIGGYEPHPSGPRPKQRVETDVVITSAPAIPRFQSILVERFRNKLKARGGRGIVGMRRQFKIMDDNGSGALDINEFRKGIRDFQVDIDPKDVDNLFKAFDINNNGDIDYDEFIRVVVGPMNQFRVQLCLKAFNKIDKNMDGVLTVEDIKGTYDASRHPDVKSGKKSEDEVLREFLETFEMHHNVLNGFDSDGKVTKEEFLEYYTNISASVDSDAYFDLMMTNTWNLDGDGGPQNQAFAGTARKVTQVSAREMWRQDHHRNLFGTDKSTPFDKSKTNEWQTSMKSGHTDEVYKQEGIPGAGSATFGKSPFAYKNQFMTEQQRERGDNWKGVHHSDDDMVKMFKARLAARGARGILGMQRIFKIMDDNRNGTLEIQEFWKALCDFRVALNPEEARKLFDLFDRNGDGAIDYDELLRAVAGEMNGFRKALVKKAFQKIDKNGNGIIEIDDIKASYNAKQHPDVKSGKKSEEEILSEFLDTFELHHSLKNPDARDRKVDFGEFVEYYNNVGASVDNDQYFELMITNAWNLNDKHYQKGWGAEY